MKVNNKEVSYKQTLKSMDTEETIDLVFYRPIGFMWAVICAKLGISPNAITIASIFIGVAAGVLFYFDGDLLWLNYVGIVLLILANSFDSADGQLARMTGQYSRIGRILDGLSGDFWFVAIYFAICFRVDGTSDFFSQYPWLIWVIAIVAGLSHAKQAAMADYYRQFHLYFLKGKDGSELDSVDQLDEAYRQVPWKGNFWKKATMFFYRNYTANQEVLTPNMQKLRRKLKSIFGDDEPSQQFRDAFRAKSKPLMKYTNWLSFNLRTIALFAAILSQMPWLYFAFEIVVLNAMMVYMMRRHENICRILTKELEDGAFKRD